MATTRRLPRVKYDARTVLVKLGIDDTDARALLRSANQLRRWFELECGIDAPHEGALQAVARDEETGKLTWYNGRNWNPYYGRDTETLAMNTIKQIMAKHPELGYYIQGDPRGCSLYILRPNDVPAGADPGSYYSHGIAVYKE